MNYSINFSDEAQEELRDIALYIKSYNPEKAAPFVNDIIDHFEEVLGRFPKSGKIYLKQIRKLTYKKYTAFYVVDEEHIEIEIIHIVDLSKPLEARGINF